MKKKITIVILVLIIIILSTVLIIKNEIDNKSNSFSIVFAGDAFITSNIIRDSYNYKNNNYNFSKMLIYIKDYIKDYDLAFYNQETPIAGTDYSYSGSVCFNTPSNFGIDMINAGFNIVNLANNHILDGKLVLNNKNVNCINNERGVINSLNFWEEYKDIYVVGSYKSQKERDNIIIKELNGIKYVLLSYTYGTNFDDIIDYNSYLVNVYSDEQVKKDVEKIKNKVDVILVSMHWGDDFSLIPNDFQKEKAKYLSSLGVDVIIGHHPHVIQPIEWIDDTLVIYSLGNVITGQSNAINSDKLLGMMVSLEVKKRNDKIDIKNIKAEFIYTKYNNQQSDFVVLPFSYLNENDENFSKMYHTYSKIVKLYDNIYVNKMGEKRIVNEI